MIVNRASTTPILSPSAENAGERAGESVFHLHPEIVKEDAFFRLDTVSSTRGQIELRFWFPVKLRNTV